MYFSKLREEFRRRQAPAFNHLQNLLTPEHGTTTYADIARALNMTEGAIKVAVYRLRKRYGEVLRAEIAGTVSTPAEVEDELRHLLTILAK